MSNQLEPRQSPPAKKERLRRRAEAAARSERRQSKEAIANLSPDEIEQIIHELRVHQIELEMQNDDLRQTQDALSRSQAKYFDLYDMAPVGYLTINQKGVIQEANLTSTDMLDVPRQSLLGQPFTHFILPDDQDVHYLHNRELRRHKSAQTYEIRMRRAGDNPLWVSVNAVSTSTYQTYWLTLTDISVRKEAEAALKEGNAQLQTALTELQHAQKALVQQERLAAVGQLAAGIAHDFNNILAILLLNAELGLRTASLTDARNRLRIVEEQTHYAARLVEQILDFSRRALITPEKCDLIELLTKQIALLKRTIPENVEIDLQMEPDSCPVHVDPDRIQQAMTNLVLNGFDAMPDGGRLTIKVERYYLDSDASAAESGASGEQEGPPPGAWARITVQDTGAGIPDDVLPHIFEPFFTTKEPGSGTGLGLSQVIGIIKQHNGYIQVESGLAQGSTFIIDLPLAPDAATSDPAQSAEQPVLHHGTGQRILIVEDQPVLQETLADVLQSMAYETYQAGNGAEALQLLAEKRDVALVISDMVMPQMSGEKLLQAMHNQQIDIPVILISGYPLSPHTMQGLRAYGLVGCLDKPPDIYKMSALISQALAERLAST